MLTSAGFNNPSAERPSGDKITDVNLTPSFSPPESDFSFKSSSVNNREKTDGSEDAKISAPTKDEDFKPVELRANDWRKKNKKLSMTKLIMKRAVRRSNDLESPENSRTSQGDTDVSSLIKLALERGKDVALKQAEKTAFQNPQETSTADKNKLLEKAMLWKRKILDPSYKVETSWDTENVLERDLEATSEPSHGGLESIATSLLQSARPTSVTDAPYVPTPTPTPKLINLLTDAPTSARQTNPAEYLKSDSAETEVELNLNNGESETTESANSGFAKPDKNLDMATTLSAAAEAAKSYFTKTETNTHLPSTQSTSTESASSYSENAEMTTAESANSDHEKAEMNPNLPTIQNAISGSSNSYSEKAELQPNPPASQRTSDESTESYSDEAKMEQNLAETQWVTGDPGKSDSEKSDQNLYLNSYEPSTQSGPAETPVSSPSVDPQATPEDTGQETTEKGYSEKNRESGFPHDQPSVSIQERFSQYGTSATPDVNMNVHPKMSATSGLRWHVALKRRDTGDDGKDKQFKTKKKKKKNSSSTTKDPADSKSPIIVGGIIGGIFMLMAIVACFIQLW